MNGDGKILSKMQRDFMLSMPQDFFGRVDVARLCDQLDAFEGGAKGKCEECGLTHAIGENTLCSSQWLRGRASLAGLLKEAVEVFESFSDGPCLPEEDFDAANGAPCTHDDCAAYRAMVERLRDELP